MTVWQRGEIVDVVIRGVRVVETDPVRPDWLTVEWIGDDGQRRVSQVETAQERVMVVVRQVPVEGVPRAGDVWADDTGRLYMARWLDWRAAPEIVLVDTDQVASGVSFHPWREVYQDRGLRLVWRPAPAQPPAPRPADATAVLAASPAEPPAGNSGCVCSPVHVGPGSWSPDPLCPVHGTAEGHPLGTRHD